MDSPVLLIHHVYFTCGEHFAFLLRSLRSLVAMRSVYTGGIYIYIDKDDKLTQMQIDQINACCTQVTIRQSGKVTYGESTINAELECLRAVAEAIHPESYIAKTDSDIIFISGKIFQSVINSDAEILGEAVTHFSPFLYTQGGCYFIKANVAREFTKIDDAFCIEVLALLNNEDAKRRHVEPAGSPGEDAAIFHLAVNRMGKKACFLDGYRRSILHFSGKKNDMFRYDRRNSFLLKYKYVPMLRRVVSNAVKILGGKESAKRQLFTSYS